MNYNVHIGYFLNDIVKYMYYNTVYICTSTTCLLIHCWFVYMLIVHIRVLRSVYINSYNIWMCSKKTDLNINNNRRCLDSSLMLKHTSSRTFCFAPLCHLKPTVNDADIWTVYVLHMKVIAQILAICQCPLLNILWVDFLT